VVIGIAVAAGGGGKNRFDPACEPGRGDPGTARQAADSVGTDFRGACRLSRVVAPPALRRPRLGLMTTTKRRATSVDPDFTAAELRALREIQAALQALPAEVAARLIRRLSRELLEDVTLPN
jgi:hypothetical protein